MQLASMAPSPFSLRFRDLSLLLLGSSLIPSTGAINFKSAPSPNLDLSGLGRVALAGSFDSISLYNYVGQDEDGLSSNGSQSLIGQFPSGGFAAIQSSDAYIESMCPFVAANGQLNGIIVGGNFTSLGGQEAQAVALFDPVKNSVSPLPGLSGSVQSVYCDNERSTVYFGGMFSGASSTNAIAWTDNWTNLPFAGFNGPVSAISKLPNGNIIFAGEFTGIGNMTEPRKQDAQVINVGSADFSIQGETTNPKYGGVENLYCTTASQAGPGTSFILEDNTPGYLQANFRFPFTPSKLRLLNSQVEGYGTKVWRFTASPEVYPGSILNFTYYDENGLQSCTNECPLANNGSYQDFFFVNEFQMSAFQIDISGWYGKGGGLSGFELFQNDIYSYAVDEFNEPHCDSLDSGATSKQVGQWTISQPGLSNYSQYLTTTLADGTVDGTDVSVTFMPNIKQSGQYMVLMYTPGCIAEGTCETRGAVDVIGDLGSANGASPDSFNMTLYQTNYNDKYDVLFYGYVEANNPAFRPTVTLSPSLGQYGPRNVVAQTVQFRLMSTADGLNGLYEFNPNLATADTNFDRSVVDSAGTALNDGALFLALADDGSTTYAAGAFSSDSVENILAITSKGSSALSNGGLNDVVQTLWFDNGILYAGGNFTSSSDNTVLALENVAAYDISSKKWSPLGHGVNGMVYGIVPFNISVTGHGTQEALGISGYFDEINSFDKYSSHSVANVAVWIPALGNWLQNVDSNAMAISGQLNAYTSVPGMAPLWSGGVDSQMLTASNVVRLTGSEALNLQSLPVTFQTSSNSGSSKKRALSSPPVQGVSTGLFYNENGLSLTILGGDFTADATSGGSITNLLFINGTNNDQITGPNSGPASSGAILALDTQGASLFAGGSIDRGLFIYDLVAGDMDPRQPPSLSGRGGTVNAIATRPATSSVYVGGSFSAAGSLPCAGLCIFDASLRRWNQPGTGLASASVINVLEWSPSGNLVVAGDLRLRGKRTTMASYDPKKEAFTAMENADSLPGPITAFTAIDSSFTSAFVAGTSGSGNAAYLAMFDGSSTWTTINGISDRSVIEGLQILSLSTEHDSSDTVNANQVLLVTGKLQLPRFGPVSAALYDGSKFTPFALSTMSDGSPGSISQVFVQNTNNLLIPQESFLALGFIVLIGLACALGTVFLIVVAGILVERVRRRREGYIPAPTGAVMYEKSSGGKVGKISAEKLFEGVGPGGGGTTGSRL